MIKENIRALITGFLITAMLILAGCSNFLNYTLKDTVESDNGVTKVEGLKEKVVVRRDDLGIPLIEAANFDDLAYATGYVMASDRLAQMVSYSLLGQGRLSEMAGKLTLDIDMYVRTIGIDQAAKRDYEQLSDDLKSRLEAFSEGVNAYIDSHKDRLPLDFKLSGYVPEPWKPIN